MQSGCSKGAIYGRLDDALDKRDFILLANVGREMRRERCGGIVVPRAGGLGAEDCIDRSRYYTAVHGCVVDGDRGRQWAGTMVSRG